MSEHLRAFVVIAVLSALSFVVLRRPVVAMGMAEEDFRRRRNLWLGIIGRRVPRQQLLDLHPRRREPAAVRAQGAEPVRASIFSCCSCCRRSRWRCRASASSTSCSS
jgi:hypothetical protein